MNSQQLFYLMFIIGVALIAYFVLGRPKPPMPTRLNMKAKNNESDNLDVKYSESNQLSEPKVTILDAEEPLSRPQNKAAAKNLSIFFMYNGHDWEAHQVLGIPQGANLQMATVAYQELLRTSDPSTFDYYEAAYNAIVTKKRNQRL